MAPTRRVAFGVALSVAVVAGAADAAVTLQAMSAQVSSPGGLGRICVAISSDDEQVAGIQNKLRWDGNCATLTSPNSCVPVGSHGKSVHGDIEHQPDFTVKVLVLSFGDVDVIPDGPVYCCDFQGEAEPGSCCSVSIIEAAASDPSGKPIPVNQGGPTTLCTAGTGNQPGRDFGSQGGNQPLSTSNEPPPGQGEGAAPPAAGPGASSGGAAPAQVLAGGGVRVGNPTLGVVPPTMPNLQLPTPPMAPASAGQPAAATPQPALPPPTAAATGAPTTSAPTQAPTSPAPPDTPKKQAATAAPTKAAAAKQAAAPPNAKAEESSGWFGCQTAADASAAPVIGLGLLALVVALARRRWR